MASNEVMAGTPPSMVTKTFKPSQLKPVKLPTVFDARVAKVNLPESVTVERTVVRAGAQPSAAVTKPDSTPETPTKPALVSKGALKLTPVSVLLPTKVVMTRPKSKDELASTVQKHKPQVSKKIVTKEDATCDICGVCFKGGSKMRAHRVRHFPENKNIACMHPGCGKTFFFQKELRYHMPSHLSDEEKAFACQVCGKKFKDNRGLNRHMNVHNTEPKFPCTMCDEVFAHVSTRHRHMMVQHTGEKRYECQGCSKQFFTMADLRKHALIHTEHFKCPKCHSKFTTEEIRDQHFQRNHAESCDERLYCDVCGKMFLKIGFLRRHRDSEHPGLAPLSNDADLSKQPTTPLDPLQNAPKNLPIVINRHTKKNQQKHKPQVTTTSGNDALSSDTFVNWSNQTQISTIGHLYPCDQCTDIFLDVNSLEVHKTMNHVMKKIVVFPNIEEAFGAIATNQADLYGAKILVHRDDETLLELVLSAAVDQTIEVTTKAASLEDIAAVTAGNTTAPPDDPSSYPCEPESQESTMIDAEGGDVTKKIHRKWVFEMNLKDVTMMDDYRRESEETPRTDHDYTSGGDSEAAAATPREETASTSNQIRDQNKKSDGNDVRQTSAKKARKQKPSGQQKAKAAYQCPECTRQFHYADELEDHQHIHDTAAYQCPVCEEFREGWADLGKHINQEHSIEFSTDQSKQGPYKCSRCADSFRVKCKLVTHFLTRHLDVRPFACSLCGSTYSTFAGITEHRRFVHVRELYPEKANRCRYCDEDIGEVNLSRHYRRCPKRERKFTCHVCGMSFFKGFHLEKHIMRHSSTGLPRVRSRSYICPYCDKKLKSDTGYADHIALHAGMIYRCELCQVEYRSQRGLQCHNEQKHPDIPRNTGCLAGDKKPTSNPKFTMSSSVGKSPGKSKKRKSVKTLPPAQPKTSGATVTVPSLPGTTLSPGWHLNPNLLQTPECDVGFDRQSGYNFAGTGLSDDEDDDDDDYIPDYDDLDFEDGNDVDDAWSAARTLNILKSVTSEPVSVAPSRAFLKQNKTTSANSSFNDTKHGKKTTKEVNKKPDSMSALTLDEFRNKMADEGLKTSIATGKVKQKSLTDQTQQISSTYPCDRCKAGFDYADALEDHMEQVHGTASYDCPKCDSKFDDWIGLGTHVEMEHDVVFGGEVTGQVSKDGGKRFMCAYNLCHINRITSLETLYSHYLTQHLRVLPFPCESCSLKFETEAALLKHRRQSHQKRRVKEKAIRQSHQKLQVKEKATRHPSAKIAKANERRNERKLAAGGIQCKLCPRVSMSLKSHKSHLASHEKSRPHSCRLCNKTFIAVKALKRHILLGHSGREKLKCDQCDKTFQQKNKLLKHKWRVHCGLVFTCHVCDKIYRSKGSLILHLATHNRKEDGSQVQ